MAKRKMEQNIWRTISFLIMIFNIIYTTSGSDCGKEFTGIKGRFSSPNYPYHYPSNTECTWIIKSPVDISDPEIVLKFRKLDIEPKPVCNYDYVEVGYGNISENNLLGRFCGQIKPRPMKFRSRVMWLRFVSNAEKTYKGFLASWKVRQQSRSRPFPNPGSNVSECGDSNLFGDEGSIKSPRYPRKYPHHLQCRWVIKALKQKQLVIRFEYFDLEGASKCRFDYVAVRDGENDNSSVIGIYCGFSKPATITTSNNVASITFNSDTSISGGGFIIRWNTIDHMVQPTTMGPTLAVICGGQFTSRNGTLKSPSYPNFYPEDKKCTWLISVKKPSRILLTFKEFDLEREENCHYDSVSVRDADSKEIGKYCGQTKPGTIMSRTSSLYIIFESDKSAAGKGFLADWVAVDHPVSIPTESTVTPTTSQKCGGRFSDSTGVITSPGYPSLYPSNQNCVWILSMPSGNQIRLNFEYFDLEVNVNCAYDYLLVRDGTEADSTIIGRFCGPSTYIAEHVLYSSGNDLRIEFHSDISSSKGGFLLSWKGSVQSTNHTPGTQPDLTGGPRLHKVFDSCGGTSEPNVFSGTIFSPGYPEPYKPNLNCTWIIQVPKNNQVSLSFNEFELEESPECTSDYVIVKDGISENSNILGKYCGTKVPISLMSTKNELSLNFHSNKINIANGFELSWMRYQPLSNTLPTVSEQETICVKQANTLSGKASLSEEQDQCRWSLHAVNGNQIQLDFTIFDFGNNNPSCLEDYIEVLNGLTEQAPVMAKFCTTNLPYQITSTGRHLTVRYVMSGKVQTKFELNYKEIGKKKNDQNGFINRGGCGLSTLKGNIDLNKKERRKNVLGEWPWQAALMKKGMSAVTCGSFLIAPQWVIGAAHCFKRSSSNSDWIVKLGLVDVQNSGADHAQTFEVKIIHVHPDYNRTTNENDIALIKLHQPAILNKYVNTICLPQENSKELYEPGNTCHVVGWETNHPLSSMAIPLVRKSECDNFADFVVTTNMLCAGYTGIDTCQGDGGGALMCRSNQTFVAIGINSVGKGCGDREHYGIYTDVRPFLDWIKMELLK